MSTMAFDDLTRRAAESVPVSRRASLLTLAAAGLLPLGDLLPAAARKKRGKKNKKKLKKLAAKQCKGQVGQCFAFAAATCGDDQQCHDNAPLCCPFLGQCGITEFLGCVLANS